MCIGQRFLHHGDHRHGPSEHVGDRHPGSSACGAVLLDHPRRVRTLSDPAGVDDPDRVGIDATTVAPDAVEVARVDPGGVRDLDDLAGLLPHLTQDRVARVFAVIQAAAGEGPQFVACDARSQSREQDVVVTHDDGVRRHTLDLRQIRVGSRLRGDLGRWVGHRASLRSCVEIGSPRRGDSGSGHHI